MTIKLQRVEHPIPLIVKSVGDYSSDTSRDNLFEKGGGRIAFDFFEGDWMPPVGNGKVADVEFVRLPHEDFGEVVGASGVKGCSYRDSVDVRFVGKDNGLIEVNAMPTDCLKVRQAPESGYVSDYLCWKGKDQQLLPITNFNENRIFCFRIRTKRDDDGNVVEAYFGKLYRDMRIMCSMHPYVPVASVRFLYYLNPKSLDRNLEWDCKTNLSPNPGTAYGTAP